MAALKPLVSVLVLMAPVVFVSSAHGQSGPAAAPGVEVRNVQFATVRPAAGGDAWLEALVDLNVRGSAEGGVYSRFVDRVEVTLSLSVRKRDGDFDFFRARAEAVALEAGQAAIRFYLPPEILRREQLSGDPVAFLVELAVGGRALPPAPGSVSPVLRQPEALRSFRDRVTRAAPVNDGVLVPQFESPFATQYPGDTPSFVRRAR